MYGMVNIAIRDMVLGEHGSKAWEQIRTLAGVDENFEKMESYPDEVTYSLIGAASQVLNTPAPDVMHAFGEYWVLETAEKGYGPLLRLWGNSFVTFLRNLDDLHVRVQETFKALQPPSFRIAHVDDSHVRVFYTSQRPGLAPFVKGLLSGVGKRFDTEVDIRLESENTDDGVSATFLVAYKVRDKRAPSRSTPR